MINLFLAMLLYYDMSTLVYAINTCHIARCFGLLNFSCFLYLLNS